MLWPPVRPARIVALGGGVNMEFISTYQPSSVDIRNTLGDFLWTLDLKGFSSLEGVSQASLYLGSV